MTTGDLVLIQAILLIALRYKEETTYQPIAVAVASPPNSPARLPLAEST